MAKRWRSPACAGSRGIAPHLVVKRRQQVQIADRPIPHVHSRFKTAGQDDNALAAEHHFDGFGRARRMRRSEGDIIRQQPRSGQCRPDMRTQSHDGDA